ncbi:hypothetical protein MACH18_10070 [Phaeobacter italicus]|nr:hypothetical protein MACH18_10070 [Phaeobacter italicus]
MGAKDRMAATGLHRHAKAVFDMGDRLFQRVCGNGQMIELHDVSPLVRADHAAGRLAVSGTGASGKEKHPPRQSGTGVAMPKRRADQADQLWRIRFRMSCAASGMLVPGPKIALTPLS